MGEQLVTNQFFPCRIFLCFCAFYLAVLIKFGSISGRQFFFAAMTLVHFLFLFLKKTKGEFTQYPFFVRFRPFFYVFASP